MEQNEFYDYRRELRKRKSILRLRKKPGGKSFLTFKGPRLKARFSKRLELEAPVNFRRTKGTLNTLGFKKIFAYRKFREEYRLKRCLVVVDRVPRLGSFFEIEGSEKGIQSLIRKLRVRLHDRENRTYLELLARKKGTS